MKIKYNQVHLRFHPALFHELRVHKFHTQLSMNDLVNIMLKEALMNEGIKQKIIDLYTPNVSAYIIKDWEENV
jgi:hypothetical protein